MRLNGKEGQRSTECNVDGSEEGSVPVSVPGIRHGRRKRCEKQRRFFIRLGAGRGRNRNRRGSRDSRCCSNSAASSRVSWTACTDRGARGRRLSAQYLYQSTASMTHFRADCEEARRQQRAAPEPQETPGKEESLVPQAASWRHPRRHHRS